MTSALAAAIAIGELGVLSLAALVLFLKEGNTLAEAAAYALMTPLMTLSFLFQLAFLLGVAPYSPVIELLLLAGSIRVLWTCRAQLKTAARTLREFTSAHQLPLWLLAGLWGYLAVAAVVPPAEDAVLGRLLSWQTAGALVSTDLPLPPAPVNAAVLPYLFLRFGTAFGIGVLGWMAYATIGFTTYSLARRHAWPPTAFTVTLVTVSMPRLVGLATSPGGEIIPAATTAVCLLALYRLLERPGMTDFSLLILGIFFSMPPEEIGYVVPAILLILSVILLVRRHGTLIWGRMLRYRPWVALGLLAPLFVFSQLWLGGLHLARSGSWIGKGSTGTLLFNSDGLQGAFANLLRYFLESAHFTAPVDRLWEWTTGLRLTIFIQGIYDGLFSPFFDGLGSAAPFEISWVSHGVGAWFGPFGFMVVLPALGYALMRGSRRLKAIALALFGYIYFICLVCAWTPDNARLFTVVFASGGFCAAFLLPPWRFSRLGKLGLQTASLLLLAYAALCSG